MWNKELSNGAAAMLLSSFAVISLFMMGFLVNFQFSRYEVSKQDYYFNNSDLLMDANADFETRLYSALEDLGADDSVTIEIAELPCGDINNYGCVMSSNPSNIEILSIISNESDHFINGLVAHELAHVVVNRMGITAFLPKYLGSFDNDQEWIADCMAMQKVGYIVSEYGYSCSDEQLDVSQEIWDWYYQAQNGI